MSNGYVYCACRDSFEVAISDDEDEGVTFCNECEDAGCEEDSECSREDFFEDEDEDEEEFSCVNCKKDGCCSGNECCKPDPTS